MNLDTEIQDLVNINEIQESPETNSISSIEWCRKFVKQTPLREKPKTRDKWYNNYTVPGSYADPANDSPPSHEPSYELGEEVTAIEAMEYRQGTNNMDIRPRVYDKLSKAWTLLDTGSCVSCSPRQPHDVEDPNFKLKAVNGESMPTYGTRQLELQMGRKKYTIQAVIADVPQVIFGWDLFKKYSLGMDWNQWGDLMITDRKAQISSLLRHITVETKAVPQIGAVTVLEAEQNFFEAECMRRIEAISIGETEEAPFFIDNLPLPEELDPDSSENDRKNLEALAKLDKKYAEVVKRYNILKTTFDKNPKHNIKHVIDTGDSPPIKQKVRPLLASSQKSQQGKRIWEEMERMGVIERVDPSTLTQWASPLHLAKKPNSDSWRPCVDYRLVNKVTRADLYPIPTLKAFTKKLKGAKLFSVIDLRSAFFNLPIHEDSVAKTTVLSPWGGAFMVR